MFNLKKRYTRLTAIVVLIVLAVSSIFLIVGTFGKQPLKRDPLVINGELDLTHWDLQSEGEIKLSGEWSFYWQHLLTSEELKSLDSQQLKQYVDVPSVWNKYQIVGKNLPGEGFATYRLLVKTDGKFTSLALKIPTMSTAYKVMVDSKTENNVV